MGPPPLQWKALINKNVVLNEAPKPRPDLRMSASDAARPGADSREAEDSKEGSQTPNTQKHNYIFGKGKRNGDLTPVPLMPFTMDAFDKFFPILPAGKARNHPPLLSSICEREPPDCKQTRAQEKQINALMDSSL